MKVTIEPQNTPDVWRLGGTEALMQIRANQSFDTFNGQYVPQGRVDEGLFLEQVLTIDNHVLNIPSVELDSTTDSLTNKTATYTVSLLTSRRKLIRPHFFVGRVPHTLAPNTTWPVLRNAQPGRIPVRLLLDTYSKDEIHTLIATALTFLRMASDTQVGMAASSFPGTDPGFPTHVSVTDPLWTQIQAGQGLVAARGHADLVLHVEGARVTVEEPSSSVDAVITAFPQSLGVIGNLRVPIANIVEGESFDIISTNPADEGTVGWVIFP